MAPRPAAVVGPDGLHRFAAEPTVGVGHVLAVQHLVDFARDPFRVQEYDVAEFLVVGEVQNVAEIVQPLSQHGMAVFADAVRLQDLPDVIGRDEFFRQRVDLPGRRQPTSRPCLTHQRKIRGHIRHQRFQIFYAVPRLAADRTLIHELRELLLQFAEWYVGNTFVDMGRDEYDGRLGCPGLDRVEPVLHLAINPAASRVPDEKEQRTVREEELVRRVIDFLSAEVPCVQLHLYAGLVWMVEKDNLDLHATGRVFFFVEGFATQPLE